MAEQPQTRLVATLTSPLTEEGQELAALPPEVGILEVRADLAGEVDVERLRRAFSGELLYTLRSRAEGGRANLPEEERRRRLAAAAEHYDLVDLEAERDLHSPVLERLPADRRLLSWHGPAVDVDELTTRFEALARIDARYYKLIPVVENSGEELPPLQLLHTLGRRDVVAFAAGAVGVWTRLVAPLLGSPLVYGSVGDDPAAPGQPSVTRLVADYGLPWSPPSPGRKHGAGVSTLFGIIGRPVSHSLSPRLHNGAYRELGLPYLYLPFHAPNFGDFWLEVVESPLPESWRLPVQGFSVTSPYKAQALAVAGAASPLTERVGGANTLVRRQGVWEAEVTDPDGVVGPLAEHGVVLEGVPTAVWGAGGAGRAAVVGLQQAGAEVTLVNRNPERGEATAERLKVPYLPWGEADPADFRVLVHATPLGRADDDPLPFDPATVVPGAAVVDMVYRERPTALVRTLRQRPQVTVVDGREMLLHQAFAQFRLMTGRELPPELGRRLLGIDPHQEYDEEHDEGHDDRNDDRDDREETT